MMRPAKSDPGSIVSGTISRHSWGDDHGLGDDPRRKIHNLTCIELDLEEGPSVWSQFTAERSQVLWYYLAMIETIKGCNCFDPRVTALVTACDEVADGFFRGLSKIPTFEDGDPASMTSASPPAPRLARSRRLFESPNLGLRPSIAGAGGAGAAVRV